VSNPFSRTISTTDLFLSIASFATLLNRKLGYLKAAEVAKEAMERKRSVVDIVLEKGLLTKEEADEVFDTSALIGIKNSEDPQ
jgi:aspartate ammonia-lyase